MKDYLCSVRNFVLLCLAFSFSSVSVDIYSPVDLICLANGSHICFSQSSSFTCGCYKDIEAHLVFWRFSNWPQFWESKIVRIINVYSAFSTRNFGVGPIYWDTRYTLPQWWLSSTDPSLQSFTSLHRWSSL